MGRRKGSELENYIAKRFNGYKTYNSGATHGNGDVITDLFTIECKHWNTDSYSIKYDVWNKLKEEADKDRKLPLLVCQNKSEKILVTLSLNDFLEVLNDHS
jgi:hypothetical protein